MMQYDGEFEETPKYPPMPKPNPPIKVSGSKGEG